jgi:hypothetical protein
MINRATPWLTQRAAAEYFQISERTLQRWRLNGFLQSGVHYRRKFPAANSPLLYHLELCEQALSQHFISPHQ